MSAFTDSVEHYLEGLEAVSVGARPGCGECNLDDGASEEDVQLAEEPSFSWSQCDGCGSTFGGDRHPAHGILPALPADGYADGGEPYIDSELILAGRFIHLRVCTDCLLHLANGDEPEEWQQHPNR